MLNGISGKAIDLDDIGSFFLHDGAESIISPITHTTRIKQARSGKDASSTYLYVERIPRYLHIAGLIVNITFHG